jgi:hypothetical protein
MKPPMTSLLRKSRSIGFALLCAGGATARAGDQHVESKAVEPPAIEPAQPWRFSFAMPGWLAATSGTIGLDGVNSHVYLGADTLLKHLDMVGSVSAEARKGRFGMYGDFLYVSASDGIGNDGLIEKVDVRLDQYLIDLELNYRVLEGPRGWLDVRAGVHYTNLYNKLTISPNDKEIDRASTNLVDEVGDLVRESLGELDLRGVLEERISGRLAGLNGERPALPIAPVGGREPGRLDELIRAIIERRAESLAAALRAEVEAATEQLREEARRRIDATKRKIADEIATTLKKELDHSFSLAEDWWDPYVGVRARLNLSKAFYLTAKADIGGFGVGSDLTWQASGALGCQVTRSLHAEIGYRYLYTDYDHDGFVYDVSQSGVEITAGITF